MEYRRAQEIMNSRNVIEVLHNGSPVWLNDLSPYDITATISNYTIPNTKTMRVPVGELTEGNVINTIPTEY